MSATERTATAASETAGKAEAYLRRQRVGSFASECFTELVSFFDKSNGSAPSQLEILTEFQEIRGRQIITFQEKDPDGIFPAYDLADVVIEGNDFLDIKRVGDRGRSKAERDAELAKCEDTIKRLVQSMQQPVG